MRPIFALSAVLCALALLGGPRVLRAADDTKPCCEATVDAGKKCEHKCCQKAAEAGKVCEKCHPKKDDKKESKDAKDVKRDFAYEWVSFVPVTAGSTPMRARQCADASRCGAICRQE